MFGGGSSAQAVPEQQQYQQPADSYAQPGGAMDSSLYNSSAANQASGPCAMNIKQYTDCMNQNQGDMNICGWYMEQLRACQQAAKQY
jgi:coiled-coil-helix-coiled-coil-helix domain-containing protein 2